MEKESSQTINFPEFFVKRFQDHVEAIKMIAQNPHTFLETLIEYLNQIFDNHKN